MSASEQAPALAGPRAGMRAKLGLLRVLEGLSDWRGNTTAGQMVLRLPGAPQAALWMFVSTIGELNAVEPLLRQVASRLAHLRLVLITDHAHYAASYSARYPQADVCVTLGHWADARVLARHYPPALLLLAEIPCLPSDAPCRFSVAFLAQAKRCGAGTVLVNGWLYRQQPACRMDSIERWLLQRDYVQAFDALCMQSAEGRQAMIDAGALPARVHTTGNIKFDAMTRVDWQVAQARSPRLLGALLQAGRPVIVAGCVTSFDEQRLVLRAFEITRAVHTTALLVLAPRHPEVHERIDALRSMLAEHGLSTAFRSELDNEQLDAGVQCLVLNTMGDLGDFYAAAVVAHVGVDHNVLEPLGFHKPVTVVAGWNDCYPSYPVYRMLRDAGALTEVTQPNELARAWHDAIAAGSAPGRAAVTARAALDSVRGAVQRHMEVLDPFVARAARTPQSAPVR